MLDDVFFNASNWASVIKIQWQWTAQTLLAKSYKYIHPQQGFLDDDDVVKDSFKITITLSNTYSSMRVLVTIWIDKWQNDPVNILQQVTVLIS